MIYLITGTTHTGKTALAQKLLEKKLYPYLSMDHLKMGLIRSKNTDLTPEDDNELTDYLWPIVSEIIKTAIENKQNLIVEGAYVPFNWRKSFNDSYLNQIRFICLAMSDKYIEDNFNDIVEHSSDVEHRVDDTTLLKLVLTLSNHHYIDGFKKVGEKIVIIDENYENTINKLLERL